MANTKYVRAISENTVEKIVAKMNVQLEHRKSGKKQWHVIESPQFVAFSNLPETGDSFFDKVAAIVSTPKPDFDNGKLPDFFQKENTLVASSNNDLLSGIKHVPPEEAPYIWYNGNEECREEYMVHDGSYTMEKQGRKENCAKVKTPQTATILEEEKKMKVFRTNPVPKFLKARTVPTNTNKLNNNDDRNDKIKSDANEKAQSINKPKRPTKKNTEIWKKPPFMPFLPKKESSKTKSTIPSYSITGAREEAFRKYHKRKRNAERTSETSGARCLEEAGGKRNSTTKETNCSQSTTHSPLQNVCAKNWKATID